jgi:HK97 family phage major capsid protein
MDGAVWANILTLHASTSGEFTQPIGVVTISPTGQLLICGIPVYVVSWVGADEVIIGDWSQFEIVQSESLSLQFFEQDGTNVRENKITVRIEASIGFALYQPAAFSVLSVESVS